MFVSGSGYLVPSTNLQSSLWQLRLYLDHWRVQLVLASPLVVMIHTPRKVLEANKCRQHEQIQDVIISNATGCYQRNKQLRNSHWRAEQLWRHGIISSPEKIQRTCKTTTFCRQPFHSPDLRTTFIKNINFWEILRLHPTTINGSSNNLSCLTSPFNIMLMSFTTW